MRRPWTPLPSAALLLAAALLGACDLIEDQLPDPESSFAARAVVPAVAVDDGRLVLNLLVTDALGRPLRDFPEDAVRCFGEAPGQDPTPIPLIARARLDEPMPQLKSSRLSFAAVLDHSGSVPSDALRTMSRSLNRIYGVLAPPFESGVIHFAATAQLAQGFTDDPAALQAAANRQHPDRGETALYDGLLLGIDHTRRRTESLFRAILLFTDGNDNASAAKLADVIAGARRHQLPLYIVAVGFADLPLIRDLARQTGGFYTYVPSFKGLAEAYDALGALITSGHQLLLDAAPADFRRLRLEIDTPDGTRTIAVDLAAQGL